MRVSLTSEEVLDAVICYMALRGFKTGTNFNFEWDVMNRKFIGLELDVEQANIDIEKVKKLARGQL